jgi:ferredoxin
MRLDLFLPFLRKPKKGSAPPSDGWLIALARRVLPARWLADRATGKPGLLRRALKWIGPTWLSSPVRRAVQVVCLLLFAWLFFYVCWPYSAQPARTWGNLKPQGVEEGGRATAVPASPLVPAPRRGATLHLVETGTSAGAGDYFGPFRLESVAPDRLVIVPARPLEADVLAQLSFSTGPWSLSEAAPGSWPSHYADELASKEWLPAESILIIDPLVPISTAIASRTWVWSLGFAGVILLAGVIVPRGFCGYICPLGTIIDFFDWAIAARVKRFRVADDGWWVHIKYYLLAGTVVAAFFGVLVSGYVAAIPIVTRAMLFLFEPLQTRLAREALPPMNAGHFVSIGLFALVLALGFLKPRFWCKYVCPSGATFSLGNLFRVSERKVESSCINCNKCVEICPFDAIKPDFTTRTTDCTLCQTCGGVCPTHAIKFVERWNVVELKVENDPPTNETAIGRRGFLSLAAGTAVALVGGTSMALATRAWGAKLEEPSAFLPIRPPGSVAEQAFLQMCIRCGECFKACPNNVLQALGFEQGLEGLWTPHVVADWAGCESSCNACGQVCPTGAIRALPLEEKKAARMGLAVVNRQTCLPFAGREDCDWCVQECQSAGYNAIEFIGVGTEVDDMGNPLEGTGFIAPVVLPEKCVGCGLCQMRCYVENVHKRGVLSGSAIVVEAGEGKEDRLHHGSYVALREAEAAQRRAEQERLFQAPEGDGYLPDFLK